MKSELAALDRKIQLELAPPTPEVAEKENEGQQLKPETYLLQEENGNLFMNTGFRIDVSYNAATDCLLYTSSSSASTAGPSGVSKPLPPDISSLS